MKHLIAFAYIITASVMLNSLNASAAIDPVDVTIDSDYSDSDSECLTVIDTSDKDKYIRIDLTLQDHEGRDLRKYKLDVTKGMRVDDFKFMLWHLELKESFEIPDDQLCIDLMDVYLEGTYLQDHLELDEPATLYIQLASNVIIGLK